MDPTFIWEFCMAFILLCLKVKEVKTCDYAFANLDHSMNIDWSTVVGSVVYTVQVQKMPENVPATDLVLEIDPPVSAFKLNEANSYEIMVNECLVYITYYDIVVKISNDTSCLPGTLSLTTILATPVYNMPTTELTATFIEDPFQSFTSAFTIEILNDDVFGGCAAFSCNTTCQNDEGQDFSVNTHTNLVEARKSTLTLGFTYDLEVTCLDDIKNTFVTPAHSIYVNITFYPETTSPEQTTPTTVTSTSVQTSTPDATTTSVTETSTAHATTSTSTLLSTILASTSTASVETTQSRISTFLQTSSASTGPTPTQVATTGGGAASSAGNTGFFSETENILTVVLPAVAFGSASLFGFGYILRKKLKKSTVEPVLVA